MRAAVPPTQKSIRQPPSLLPAPVETPDFNAATPSDHSRGSEMKLGFLTILIKNFKTIRSMQFNFDRPVGVHLVCGDNRVNKRLGSNGAGKSSIFDALCFCLYGKTPDGKRGPDLIPWSGGDTIDVAVLTNDRHAIRRTHSPNKLSYDGKVVDQTKL